MKAKFIKRLKGGYKYGKKQNDILVYEYRGYEYDIEDIPKWEQPAWYYQNAHFDEQSRIDKIILEKNKKSNKETKEFDINEIFEMLEWNGNEN